MENKARSVVSNQTGIHEELHKILLRHKQSTFKRPIAAHTQEAFLSCLDWLGDWQGEVILDSCCGVGESTINIAAMHPKAKVIGVDKSIARLDKHKSYQSKKDLSVSGKNANMVNYCVIQADLNDFWRLLRDYKAINQPPWQIVKHFILYPNPYPKKAQIGKRWHASALMPYVIALCSHIEVRSNWKLYLQEFLCAAEFYGLQGQISELTNAAESINKGNAQNCAMTPFERKYMDANQICFKLAIRPSGCDKL